MWPRPEIFSGALGFEIMVAEAATVEAAMAGQ